MQPLDQLCDMAKTIHFLAIIDFGLAQVLSCPLRPNLSRDGTITEHDLSNALSNPT